MSRPRVRTNTGAKVTLTLELSNLGSWGPACQMDQIYKQAREAAIGRICKAFKDDALGIKVVGQVVVQAITTDLESRP